MSQSTNARPCNCDQALEAEATLQMVRNTVERERELVGDDDPLIVNLLDALGESDREEYIALKRECGRLRGYERSFHRLDGKLGAANAKLDAITRILCDLVSAPSLSVAQFADPTLERIRLAMLGRAR